MRAHVPLLCLVLGAGFGCSSGGDESKPDPCKNSICGPSRSGADGSGGTSSGGGGGKGGKGGSSAASGGASGSFGNSGATGGQGGSTGGSSSGGDAGAGDTGSSGIGGTGNGGGSAGSSGGSSGSSSSSGSGGSAGSLPCQGDDCGPIAALDMDFYQCNVEPIFDRSCAMLGCHGSDKRPFRLYARGRLRNDEDLTVDANPAAQGCVRGGTVNLAENGTGTVMCEGWTRHTATEWQRNFDSASAFMRTMMSPDDSELLLQPTEGGLPHVDVHPFEKDDASYTLIRRWLSGEKLGRGCNPEFN